MRNGKAVIEKVRQLGFSLTATEYAKFLTQECQNRFGATSTNRPSDEEALVEHIVAGCGTPREFIEVPIKESPESSLDYFRRMMT